MLVLWKQQLYKYKGSSAIKEDCFLKEVILYLIPMSFKCFILTLGIRKSRAWSPLAVALVYITHHITGGSDDRLLTHHITVLAEI
jgi:hypothetical protein